MFFFIVLAPSLEEEVRHQAGAGWGKRMLIGLKDHCMKEG